ncbi:ISL3 family transposase [Laspinema palackyanum]
MENYLNLMLGLPEVTVAKVLTEENEVYLNIKLTNLGTNCPKCQSYTAEINQNRPMIVRDLPCFNKFTYLLVPRRQFYCPCCQKYFTETLSWVDWKRRHTLRYETNIFDRVISSSIAKVASVEGLSYDEIEGIFNHMAKKQEDKHWLEAKRISIDEIAMHKGHQDYKAVICDLDKNKLIEVIDGRTQDCLIERLSELPSKVRKSVKEVSVDMWHGFPKVIKEIFPNAQIVTDRFHVMKLLIEELKKIAKSSGVKEKNKLSLVLRNKIDLKDSERDELENLLSKSKRLKAAYEYKEEFRNIYETSQSVSEGEKRFQEWLNKARQVYGKVINTISDHLSTICNYFISHASSGVMEGINNKIKLVKRQGYGFRNFENFRLRLLAAFSS